MPKYLPGVDEISTGITAKGTDGGLGVELMSWDDFCLRHLELEQAEEIRRQFFRTYGALRQWHGESRNKAAAGAREARTVLGRRRIIPQTASEWEAFTALVNMPVQGGCADGMKQALVWLAERLPVEARIVSTVHDEVIVEVPTTMAEHVCDIVKATMVEAMAALFPQVPIEVEAGVCSNWAEK